MFEEMRPELIRFYEQAELRLEKLIGRAGTTAFEERRAQLLLQQIDSTLRALENHQRGWSEKNLPRAYRRGMELTNAAWNMPVLPPMTLINRQQVNTLIARSMADTAEALESIAPFSRRVWIDTQQRLVREEAIARLIAEGTVEGLGPEELSRRIQATLRDAAGGRLRGVVSDELRRGLEQTARGEFITITTRTGGTRRYTLKYYGELVARTAPRQAATEGAIQRTLELGGDLVTISVHANSCPICLPFQGKTYSLTGQTAGFGILPDEARPPIHPNCRHVLMGTSEDAFLPEELDRMRDVSASEVPVADVGDWQERLDIGNVTSVGVA